MTVGICSGYFQRLHEGHKKYIQTAALYCDRVIVIVNNDDQQKAKYKDFTNLRTAAEIAEEVRGVFPGVETVISVDTDGSVRKTLHYIYRRRQSGDVYYFCKDADRNSLNIPESDTLNALGICLLHFGNPKENSSSQIMRDE